MSAKNILVKLALEAVPAQNGTAMWVYTRWGANPEPIATGSDTRAALASLLTWCLQELAIETPTAQKID